MISDDMKELMERFGPNGLKELGNIENKTEFLLHRLLIVTTIAANLHSIDPASGEQFLKNFEPLILKAQQELQSQVEKFTHDHGEL